MRMLVYYWFWSYAHGEYMILKDIGMKTIFLLAVGLAAALSFSCVSSGPTPPAEPASQPKQTTVEPDILALIESGDTIGLQQLFKGRELADKPGADGRYPLHLATVKNSLEMVDLLLAMGAKPDPRDADGKTPLRYAVDAGDERMARSLLSKGASVFAIDSAGVTPLDSAIAKGFTAKLLDRNTVATRGLDGRTPLHMAVDRLSPDAVQAILALDPDVNVKDAAGRTPLDAAYAHPGSPISPIIAEALVTRNAASSVDAFSYFTRAVRDTNYARTRFVDGATVLHEAVRFDQRGFLTFFLDRGVPVDARNASGSTALHEAMKSGALEAAKILLAKGADPNSLDGNGSTPLHLALPGPGANAAMVLLLGQGANPSIKDKSGDTALQIAVALGYPAQAIEMLLAKGAPLDSANAAGDTALSLATRRRNADLVPLLVAKGANIFVKNSTGESPLSIALGDGPDAASLLLKAAPKDIKDDTGETPYHLAVRLAASPATIEAIAKIGLNPSVRNIEGDSPLHLAVRRNARPQGEALLKAGADPYSLNGSGKSPLTLALVAPSSTGSWFFTPAVLAARDASGNGPMHYAAMAGLPDGIAYLASLGTKIDEPNADGRTAVMLSLRNDSVSALRALLALGAESGRRDNSGATAMHLAVYWSAREGVKLLAETVKTVDLRDYTGKTPLRDAVDKDDRDMISFLLSKKADPLAGDNTGKTPLHAAARLGDPFAIKSMVSIAERIDTRDDSGVTALLEAMYAGSLDAARILAASGASIHARDATGESPLSFAAKAGVKSLGVLLNNVNARISDADGRSVVRVILETKPGADEVTAALAAGAPPNDRDARGRSPLHFSVSRRLYDISAILVAAGADAYARDVDGNTPAGLAFTDGEASIRAVFGARPNLVDLLGDGPLHYAAASGQEKGIVTLLALGSDTSLRNAAGEIPADVARRRGFTTLAELLKPSP
ncbi:MAG: hypothetical protein E4H20_02760 [Spirochaetales bacterium]|nr:MAG: hypothetical protein E4H20_02760 [Spirochaetales bacterium]